MVRAKGIFISNFLGIREFSIAPGVVTVIQGPNGLGKSSLLESIKTHVVGGNDATLLRNGADHGEAILELSDGLKLRKDLKANGETPRSVIHPQLGDMKRPASIISKLCESLSIDPAAFMSPALKPEQRVKIVLESMPLEVTAEQIAEGSGVDLDIVKIGLVGTSGPCHALELIGHCRKRWEEFRADFGRQAKTQRGIAESIQLPPDSSIDWVDAIQCRQEDRDSRMLDVRNSRNAISSGYIKMKAAAERAMADAESAAVRRTNDAIEVLRVKLAAESARLRETRDTAVREAERQRDTYLQQLDEESGPQIQRLTELVAEAQQYLAQGAVIESNRNLKSSMEESAQTNEREWNRMQDAIQQLAKFEKSLLETLPIPGLEFRDGRLYFDGVVFERLNTAQRVFICIELAKLRAGELGIVVIDNLECLDQEHFDEFIRQALESGLQWVVGRVSDGALRVATIDTAGEWIENEVPKEAIQ